MNISEKWYQVRISLNNSFFLIISLLFFFRPFADLSGRENSTTYYNRGVELFRQGDIDSALEAFSKSAEKNSNYALAHYGIGRVYLRKKGKAQEAARHLYRAVELDQSFARGHFYLGMALLLTGKYNESIASFKKAYERDITLNESLYNIAVCYELMGDPLNSIVYFRKYYKALEKKEEDIF